MKMNLQTIKTSLILLIANIFLYHFVVFLGVFVVSFMAGIDNANILILIPSLIYAATLLIYERVITVNNEFSTKIYWVITLIIPATIYGIIFISSYHVNIFHFDLVEGLYVFFFGSFFIFTSVIVCIEKFVVYLSRKSRGFQ